ncbi:hypothetical protein J6590_085682 [Homalodisca vitripennis]|nr:hypothetical protein J6590_085682 [Homalodisca vitripennis]
MKENISFSDYAIVTEKSEWEYTDAPVYEIYNEHNQDNDDNLFQLSASTEKTSTGNIFPNNQDAFCVPYLHRNHSWDFHQWNGLTAIIFLLL